MIASRFRLVTVFLSLWCISATASTFKDHPSPYLNLHANDPVKWQTWGKQALDQARAENKLVFLSIGYFSCHWCHVMQRESYQDETIGAFLNKYFIPVKVDRELRPVLDRRMIRFVEEVRGQAGWPLNVFVTADGYPVTGFTYLPAESFLNVLQQLNRQWRSKNEEIQRIAKLYFEQTENNQAQAQEVGLDQKHYKKLQDSFISQVMLLADELQGGFGDTSKFPSYPQLSALLKVIQSDQNIDQDVIRFARLTLDMMASRHLMDHVNDGFFRYTTDPDWQTPHYEKMLYDNAQLAHLYLDAESLWPGQGYQQVGLRTIDFMLRTLRDRKGGFNSSLSAVDEKDIEGGAYFWTSTELQSLLNEQELVFLLQQNLLHGQTDEPFLLKPILSVSLKDMAIPLAQGIIAKLRKADKPIMPVDDKKIASWNALVLKALLKAQSVSKDDVYKFQADHLYHFLSRQFIQHADNARSPRVNRFDVATQVSETTLEDYAQLSHAIALYAQLNASEEAYQLSRQLVEQAFELFHHNGTWKHNPFSLVPGEPGSLVIQDDVIESPLSMLLDAVFLLPEVNESVKQLAQQMIVRLTKDVLEVPYHYGSSIVAANRYIQQRANSAKLSAQ